MAATEAAILAQIRQMALTRLAGREHSRFELSQRLQAKGYETGAINEVLDALEQEGQLSDSRFVAAFIRYRMTQGQGPLKIQSALYQRGIQRDQLTTEAIAWEGDCWNALACQVRAKRFGIALPQNLTDRAKQTRFLQARGFSFAQIKYALAHHDAPLAGAWSEELS